jgi:hypothetical protein
MGRVFLLRDKVRPAVGSRGKDFETRAFRH